MIATAVSANSRAIRRAFAVEAVAGIVTIGCSVTTTTPAQATDSTTTVHGRYLTLTSIGDAESMGNLSPGDTAEWQVGVEADVPTVPSTSIPADAPPRIGIALAASGSLAEAKGLRINIRACTTAWLNGTCAGVESEWLPDGDLSEAVADTAGGGTTGSGATTGTAGNVPKGTIEGERLLGSMDADDERWLLVRATLTTHAAPGGSAEVRIHAWGSGDDLVIGPTDPAGPAGPAGPTEPTAPTGPSGTSQPPPAAASVPKSVLPRLGTTGITIAAPLALAVAALLGGVALAGMARVRDIRNRRISRTHRTTYKTNDQPGRAISR